MGLFMVSASLGVYGRYTLDPAGRRCRWACSWSAPPGWVQCVTTVDPKGRVRGPTRPILLLVAHARGARGRPRAPLAWCVGALPPDQLAAHGPAGELRGVQVGVVGRRVRADVADQG